MTETTTESATLVVASDADVVKVRQAVRDLAVRIKLSIVDQTKLVTATSELARNTLVYGGGGEVTAGIVERGGRTGVELLFSDDGPGIPDLELALTDGWTSGNGMGLGLSGTKRLVDEFTIDTAPGQGTRVRILKWRR